jgi:glycosyltransferase involved in cell wall biosynthesis
MLYSDTELKGSSDGISALEIAKNKVPFLKAVVFGVGRKPNKLPKWIEYIHNPPQSLLVEKIYNGCSIYLCPSWTEGWHLPPAEAMSCGCAVVSTDIGGVNDYAGQEKTALLSPPRNQEALTKNFLRVLEDDDLRIRLAKAGYERIQEFTWERSTDLLEQFLMQHIKGS